MDAETATLTAFNSIEEEDTLQWIAHVGTTDCICPFQYVVHDYIDYLGIGNEC